MSNFSTFFLLYCSFNYPFIYYKYMYPSYYSFIYIIPIIIIIQIIVIGGLPVIGRRELEIVQAFDRIQLAEPEPDYNQVNR